MIRCIVIDDEPLALGQMVSYVEKTPYLELVESFDSQLTALAYLVNNSIDLAFVDIEMPDLSGIAFARSLSNPPKIIFTTAYRDYALEGFEVDAADYLLKPIGYADFLKSVTKVNERYFTKDDDCIFVRSSGQSIKVNLSEILYLEAKREYVDIVMADGVITTKISLKAIEDQLPNSSFMRVHRSFIVNTDKVKVIERNRIVFNKTYIPIGDQYLESFRARVAYF